MTFQVGDITCLSLIKPVRADGPEFQIGDIIAHKYNLNEYFLITSTFSPRTLHYEVFPIYVRAEGFWGVSQIYSAGFVLSEFILVSSAFRTEEEI